MKQNYPFRRILSALIFLLASCLSWAESFEEDCISYDINADSISVSVRSHKPRYSGDIVIPSTVTHEGKTYGVTSIGKSAFSRCTSLESIVIPASVTSIEQSAFYICSSLTSIVIPDGVTSIGKQAFYGCSSLASINIPAGVTSIEQNAFRNCI